MNTSLFDMKDTIENAPEPVRFLWEAMKSGVEVNAAWGSLTEFRDEYGDAKPYFIISDKQETIDWCRENGVWLFDVVENPVPKPFTDRKLVAWDMDGTLSFAEWRSRRFLGHKDPKTGKRAGTPNWKAFEAGIDKDPVNEKVAFLYRLLRARSDVDNIILTARRGTQEAKTKTADWLTEHDLDGYQKMYIRDADDYRSDSVTKLEILERIFADYSKHPDIIVDDRYAVSRSFREYGLWVANVNQSGKEF